MNFFKIALIVFAYTLSCAAMSSAELPDISTVPADLTVPPVIDSKPRAGKRVKLKLPEYENTDIHHALYLPANWVKGKLYPVIVEYAGNEYTSQYGDVSPGTVEGSNLGYGISGGTDYIWVCMPYVDPKQKVNQTRWWGDVDTTADYCVKAVKQVCRDYGGDSSSVILAGFSRGAIACNYIGLRNDKIAGIWAGFIAYSHYDGVREWTYPESDRESALKRLARLKGRPVFICGEVSVEDTRKYIEGTGVKGNFTYMAIPFRNHNDAWTLRNIPEREVIRKWMRGVVN